MTKTGIYRISSKSHPERAYVGSAINIERRWNYHRYSLRNGRHHSRFLQNHFNKYGESDLEFECLVECIGEDLLRLEQQYLDDLHPTFNSSPTAGSQLGFRHSEETRRKISELKKGTDYWTGRRHSAESKEKMREAKVGKKATRETRRKLSAARIGNVNASGNQNRKGISFSGISKLRIGYGVKLRFLQNEMRKRKVLIFADTADLSFMKEMKDSLISGWTTNPTILRKAGVVDYMAFARQAAEIVHPAPLSLEVFSDDARGMYQQGVALGAIGSNVVVKIPITNTRGEPTSAAVEALAERGVPVNVTAVFTADQAERASRAIDGRRGYISVFCGRIADTLRDPVETILEIKDRGICDDLIWASTREAFNIQQADASGCAAITVTPEVLKKVNEFGKDLHEYSLETVRMFYEDAKAAGYDIEKEAALV